MASGNFEHALALVLVHEGGCDDDPNDPGGRTKCGITHFDYDAYRKRKGLPLRDVFKMEDNERDEIYRSQYWDKVCGDDLPAGLDYVLFDGAVNSGVTQSVKWVQRALGDLSVDGQVGNVTLTAISQNPDQEALIGTSCEARREFLRNLKTFKYYGKGWIRRVNDVEKTAVAWASGVKPQAAEPSPKPQAKAVRSSGTSPPSTAPGDLLVAAGGVGLATAVATKGDTIAVAPPIVAASPSAQTQAAQSVQSTSAEQSPAPTTPKAAVPQPHTAVSTPAPVSGTKSTVQIPTRSPLNVISHNQFWVAAGLLGALLVLGLYLSWRSRRARNRHADALGDRPRAKTPLRITRTESAASAADPVPLVKSVYARALSIAWIVLTILVNVVALAKLLHGFGFAHETWHQPFASLGGLYDTYAGQAFTATSQTVSQQFGFTLPSWSMPVFVLYVSMASAFVVASAGLMKRSTSAESLWGAVVHAGWVFAVPAFVLDAVRYHVVARFARQNTVLFFAYIAAFLGVYIGARFVNDDFLATHPQQIESLTATIPSEVRFSAK